MDNLFNQIQALYENYDCMHIFDHSIQVANQAIELADRFHVDRQVKEHVYVAALLHDIGGIFPNDQRIRVAKQYEIDLVDEEYIFPLIIHQKISRYMAQHHFGIQSQEILESIECHTTLKAQYRTEDLIVFLADKIAWDQSGKPPYLDGLIDKLQNSLEEAALFYINYILDHDIKVIHPWLLDAKIELENNMAQKSNDLFR